MTVEKQEQPKELSAKLRYQRDKDREPVKGVFRFYEVPGGTLSFVYKAYKGDPVAHYTLVDGEICTLPLGVAKHLNKNGWYPVHEYKVDEGGAPSMHIGRKVSRFGFQSLEFVDIDDISPTGEPLVAEARVVEKNKTI